MDPVLVLYPSGAGQLPGCAPLARPRRQQAAQRNLARRRHLKRFCAAPRRFAWSVPRSRPAGRGGRPERKFGFYCLNLRSASLRIQRCAKNRTLAQARHFSAQWHAAT